MTPIGLVVFGISMCIAVGVAIWLYKQLPKESPIGSTTRWSKIRR